MTTCVDKLGIDKSIVDFGLPFGMVIYMPGAAVLHWFVSLSVAETYGIEVSFSWIVIAMITGVILAAASPPIPGGMAVAFSVLFSQLALPTQFLAVMLSLSAIIDGVLTSTNVFSGHCVLAVSSKGFEPGSKEKGDGIG